MDMDKIAVFFAGSILITLGMIVIAAGVIVINNLIDRYWKPVVWFKYQYKAVYFDPKTGEQFSTLEKDEKIEPHLEEKKK
jgi:hypothetical protein